MIEPSENISPIRKARLAKGLSQPELAIAADVSIPVISRMENRKNVSNSSFKRVCKVLDIDPETVKDDVVVTDRRR